MGGLLGFILLLLLLLHGEIVEAQYSVKNQFDNTDWYPSHYQDMSLRQKADWLISAIANSKDPGAINDYRLALYTTYGDLGLVEKAIEICHTIDFSRNPLFVELNCMDQEIDRLPVEQSLAKITNFLQRVRREKDRKIEVFALLSKAWILSTDGNFPEALSVYSDALAITPAEDPFLRSTVQFELAIAYYSHGDDDYIKKAVEILTKVKKQAEEMLKRPEDDMTNRWVERLQFSSFNLGMAFFSHLHQFEAAIPHFKYVIEKGLYEGPKNDAAYLIALCYAEIGQFEEAKMWLKTVAGRVNPDPIREKFLQCYKQLTIKFWDPTQSHAACFDLHPESTMEVLININRRLAKIKDDPLTLRGLQSYVNLYETKVIPEYRKKAAKAASQAELKRLELENRLKDQQIAFGKKIQRFLYVISVISLILLLLLILLLRLNRKIRSQSSIIQKERSRLRLILDEIDSVIILIGKDETISPVYSAYAEKVFGKAPHQNPLRDLLTEMNLTGDRSGMVRNVMKITIGEDEVSWQLNAGHLPQEVTVGGDRYLCYWTPIFANRKVQEVILYLRNASALEKMERLNREHTRIIDIYRAGDKGLAYLVELKERIDALIPPATEDRWRASLRLAHTLKGDCRNFGFSLIQDYLHEYETLAVDKDVDKIQEKVNKIREEIAASLQVVGEVGSNGLSPMERINDYIQTCFRDANERLLKAGFHLESKLSMHWDSVSDAEIEAIKTIASHSISNSVDHGYLDHRDRFQSRERRAVIDISLNSMDESRTIIIKDGGGGLPWEALRKKAKVLGYSYANDKELTQLLFLDSVSTKEVEKISHTSGRGIGMAAIYAAVQDLGGRLELTEREQGVGTQLTATWIMKPFEN